jgi:hypothetical protein
VTICYISSAFVELHSRLQAELCHTDVCFETRCWHLTFLSTAARLTGHLQVYVDLGALAAVMETRLRVAEAAALASRARQDSVETATRVADGPEGAEGIRREEIANRVWRKMDGIRTAQMYRIAAGDLRASVLNGEQPLMVILKEVLQLLQTPRTFLPAATVVDAATVFPCFSLFHLSPRLHRPRGRERHPHADGVAREKGCRITLRHWRDVLEDTGGPGPRRDS